MADYYRDVVRLLRENGCEFKRQGRGDHEIWWNLKTGAHVTVDRKLEHVPIRLDDDASHPTSPSSCPAKAGHPVTHGKSCVYWMPRFRGR
ncbi:MAG TPA: type II toxin-antitoxin system HicA family toxin [Xanthobacteraceae bacterium]